MVESTDDRLACEGVADAQIRGGGGVVTPGAGDNGGQSPDSP